jgi:branched-subunit amino acid aminotransferase/4-amino-4-deoxychorismate lyase
MHWYLADREANRTGADMALLLDQDGNVTETSSGNLFVACGSVLHTPMERTTLPGISQQFVIGLAAQLGLEVNRTNLRPEFLTGSCDEVFLTSSTYCVAPVTRIDGKAIGDGTAGPVVRRLWKAWADVVGIDFANRG